MITKSTRRFYITLCAEGSNDSKLREMITRDPMILRTRNSDYGKSDGIYYSVKNLRLETTKLLLEFKLKFDLKEVKSLMVSWHCSPESYLFLKKIGTSLYGEEIMPKDEYNKYLLETYENYLIRAHDLPRLFKILEMEKILTNEYVQKILEKYKLGERQISCLSNFTKMKYLRNIRDIQLHLLL